MSKLKEVELEYIYITIPAEYICVYHRILAMMADYGEEMLKDCKATCTDRNSNVIECFNMFNSAVAARKLGKNKLAEVLIKYIKAKINQIYQGKDNSTSFVFPVDETGQLKAFVSCGERPKFAINPDDGYLYEHKFNNGFNEHFRLGEEDESDFEIIDEDKLNINLVPLWERDFNNVVHPCADIYVTYDNKPININNVNLTLYFDDIEINRFNDIINPSKGIHTFMIVFNYKDITKIVKKELEYEITN